MPDVTYYDDGRAADFSRLPFRCLLHAQLRDD